MSDYYNVYRQRLNRYGLDFQSRIQGTREKEFENYLYKTIYRVDFQYDGKLIPGSLERYKQDYSETQGYLLTRKEDVIPNGSVLEIESQDGRKAPWMVWWLEQIEASGYNKYVVLKMTHYIECDGASQWGFFEGPGAKMVRDTTMQKTSLYNENNTLHMFITTSHPDFKKDKYFVVGEGEGKAAYVVATVDNYSTPGVAYVSVDPVPLRDETEAPIQTPDENDSDYFWLNGGNQ
jgi:hypothetical protein